MDKLEKIPIKNEVKELIIECKSIVSRKNNEAIGPSRDLIEILSEVKGKIQNSQAGQSINIKIGPETNHNRRLSKKVAKALKSIGLTHIKRYASKDNYYEVNVSSIFSKEYKNYDIFIAAKV